MANEFNWTDSPDRVSVHFLGGLGEIGRNSALISQGSRGILVDFGVMFPKADMPGVDLVLPDYRVVLDSGLEICGVVITHGHEDHIGALPFLLSEMQVPVYGSSVTLAFVKARLDQGRSLQGDYRVVEDYSRVEIGPFQVEFIPITHSIPGSTAIAITTAQGTILHTGDFKLDNSPVDGRRTGLRRIAHLGDGGVRLLLSDSTNADEPGVTGSESSVAGVLREIFAANLTRRLTIACFASHIHRTIQIARVSRESGREIVLLGRSLQRNVKMARQLGLIPDGLLDDTLDVEKVSELDPGRVCVIATGSQGERSSALYRLAFDSESWFAVGEGDTVVFSSDTIPGNESAVNRLVNQYFRLGADVIYPSRRRVHTSGHASQDELLTMLSLARPEFFIPVHGEYRQLASHSRLAVGSEMVRGDSLICVDGDIVELSSDGLARIGSVGGAYLYVDGIVGDVNTGVLRDRRSLSEDGIVVVAVTLSADFESLGEPEVFSFGWVHDEQEEELLHDVRRVVAELVSSMDGEISAGALKDALRRKVGKFVRDRTKRRPLVVPLIVEV